MRAILDTNILVAAFFWHGPPHRLLEQVREGTITLISSPALLAEFNEVIAREKFDALLIRSRTSREHSLEEVRRLAELLDPPPLPEPVCRDPDDDQVLALAIAAQADLIVSRASVRLWHLIDTDACLAPHFCSKCPYGRTRRDVLSL